MQSSLCERNRNFLVQFQRNDKKRSAQPASEGRPAKDLQPTKSIRSGTARDSFSQPPHMRGKVIVDLVLTERHRITPAHAGKSYEGVDFWQNINGSPPHMRGKGPFFELLPHMSGSPPHMRGKEQRFSEIFLGNRITPAHAGKSDVAEVCTKCCWDHPRTCGEKAIP